MLLWLLRNVDFLHRWVQSATSGDSTIFLTGRIAAAAVLASLLVLAFGRSAIRTLSRHCGERVASASEKLDRLHSGKNRTPTMGGLLVMGAVAACTILLGDLTNRYVLIMSAVLVVLTIAGARDDWIKLRTSRNGLTAVQKLVIQLIVGGGAGLALLWPRPHTLDAAAIILPIGDIVIPLGAAYLLWAALVVSGCSNAVNLTDGLDGLAVGCAMPVTAAYSLMTYLAGHAVYARYLNIPAVTGAGEAAVITAALGGALLGFLWFNCHPASVFLGDTGSLPLGGLLATAALICRQEILLVVIGGVFVVETLSVILQVSCFRLTGKRPLRCSPLHNHFVFRGDPESKIVIRFWIIAVVLFLAGIAGLRLR